MQLLVLSDSHSAMSFMRRCIRYTWPDAVIHLGEHYDDGKALSEEYPHIIFHQVKGNCDRYLCTLGAAQTLSYPIDGVKMFITHGHLQRVKSGIGVLLAEARRENVQAVLYGHTHVADCHQEPDGIWVLNPGSCGSYGGSAGLIITGGNQILECRILTGAEMLG